MSNLVLLPVLIPFLAAVTAILARRRPVFQRALGLAGALGGLGAALALLGVVWRDGVQVLRLGDWPAPYGIILVADLFSAVMATLAGVTGVLVLLYSTVTIDHRREAFATCAELVEEVKRLLPVWKHQVFADGTDEWVNST